MRPLIATIALLATTFPACAQSGSQSRASTATALQTLFHIKGATGWKTVEEFDYAWKYRQVPVHFKLELPEHYRDPGDFIRIRIQVPGHPEFILDNEDGWVKYNGPEEKSEVYARLSHQNLTKSKYVLLLPVTMGRSGPPLVFLRSWAYASNAERLHVIGFRPSGKPILLLNTELDLEQVVDLD